MRSYIVDWYIQPSPQVKAALYSSTNNTHSGHGVRGVYLGVMKQEKKKITEKSIDVCRLGLGDNIRPLLLTFKRVLQLFSDALL